jgi:hypothetical protein
MDLDLVVGSVSAMATSSAALVVVLCTAVGRSRLVRAQLWNLSLRLSGVSSAKRRALLLRTAQRDLDPGPSAPVRSYTEVT